MLGPWVRTVRSGELASDCGMAEEIRSCRRDSESLTLGLGGVRVHGGQRSSVILSIFSRLVFSSQGRSGLVSTLFVPASLLTSP